MSVYVDPLCRHGGSASFRWAVSCHMYADTIEELHAFAAKIGLRREWFQDKAVPHYDLNERRWAAAVMHGVVQHTRREAVEFWRAKGWRPRPGASKEGGSPC